MALSTQYPSEFASFKQGITTDTSTPFVAPLRAACDPSEVTTVPISGTIISRFSPLSPPGIPGKSASRDRLAPPWGAHFSVVFSGFPVRRWHLQFLLLP